jgi:hypothetical protein
MVPEVYRMYRLIPVASILIASLACTKPAQAQQNPDSGCGEAPREDALPALCAPPTSDEAAADVPKMLVKLMVPDGTPLSIAVDQRVRISHSGQPVHGKVVDAIYAFDQIVIPAGSGVSGKVTEVDSVPAKTRIISYSNGDLTPFHKYQITFDRLILPDGKEFAIKTTVSPGTGEIVHLVANQPKQTEENKKNIASQKVSEAKREAERTIHSTIEEIKSPDMLDRLKKMVAAQSPYHRQYIPRGMRFSATLNKPMGFGETTRTQDQLSKMGGEPAADTVLHARLAAEVNSANAKRGTGVNAVLTEPVFSPDHHLLLPANSRLVGEVLEATPARKFHRNGDLRIAFNRIETPAGVIQPMLGSLEGVEVDEAANMKLDEEGGAHVTTPKTRYLSTGFAILMAAAASHPDTEHGTTDTAGDPSVRAGAGVSGSRFAGSLIALAARSQPVSIAFGAYGASESIYSNFLSRGKDVDFPKNTPLEIGFGPPHEEPRPANSPKH